MSSPSVGLLLGPVSWMAGGYVYFCLVRHSGTTVNIRSHFGSSVVNRALSTYVLLPPAESNSNQAIQPCKASVAKSCEEGLSAAATEALVESGSTTSRAGHPRAQEDLVIYRPVS